MTPPRGIRLLVSDVDGTLVTTDKRLTPATVAAAGRLRAAGVGLALTSSRPPHGMRMLVEPLGLALPLAGFNGGAWCQPDLTLGQVRLLGEDLARTAAEEIEALGLDVWVYGAQAWRVPAPDAPHVARERFILQYDPIVEPDWRRAPLAEAVKVVGVSDDHARVAAAEARLAARLGPRASATRSAPHFVDVTHPDANKGRVVDDLADRLGLDPAAVATIGDMPNDVLMFRRSGWSVAMGNAAPEVRAAARTTTLGNDEDGWARAVESLLGGGG